MLAINKVKYSQSINFVNVLTATMIILTKCNNYNYLLQVIQYLTTN